MNLLKRLVRDEEGQALSEYGLVIGVIAVAIIAVLGTFREKIEKLFERIGDSLDGVGTTTSGS